MQRPDHRVSRDSHDRALNGQQERQRIVRDLQSAIDFDRVVEAGTFRGHSADFFAAVFGVTVSTVEADPGSYARSRDRFAHRSEIEVAHGDSRRLLRELAGRPGSRQETVFFYLDAHGHDDLPLREELEVIQRYWVNAVVMIDDFQAPGDPGYGFDDWGPGKVLVRSYLPDMPEWRIYFPAASSDQETGSWQGCAVLASRGLAGAVDAVPSLVPGRDDSAPTPVRSSGRRSPAAGELAITFDSASVTDGVGSQLQRIYGLWAASRDLGVKYVHTPIERVGYQGLMPLLDGTLAPDFADRFNAVFTLPSDDFDVDGCERVTIHTLTREAVEAHRERAAAAGRSVLLAAGTPLGYTDLVPESCSRLRDVSPYRHHRPSGPLRVCVHLRRGDNSFTGRPDRADRLLPNSYYLRVLATLVEELERQGLPFVVRVHTEVPPRTVTIQPGTPGIYFRLDEPGTIDPAELALEEFAAVPNATVVANADPMDVLDDFATADVLVLARSSLGYLAGQLNPHGLVVYADWWHPPMPGWLIADREGGLDPAEVGARLAGLGRGRWSAAEAGASVAAVNPELRDRGYVARKGLLDPAVARLLWTTMLLHQWRGESFRDNHVPTAASITGTALTDALLLELRPAVEEIAGCHLVPTYSYARLYFRGDGLIRHRDRQSCEVSVSVHLGRVGGDGSLCFGDDDRVDMESGDGAVYLGCATDHWREPFTGTVMGQVFLHYVDRDGPYAQHGFDGRPERFPPSVPADLAAPADVTAPRP